MRSSWFRIALAAASAAAMAAAAFSVQAAKPKGDIRIDDVAVYPESMGAAPDGGGDEVPVGVGDGVGLGELVPVAVQVVPLRVKAAGAVLVPV